MIDSQRIGRAIRTLREKAGYTQKELADQLFISNVAVSKWERGLSIPDTATLHRLSLLLDMDVDGLLGGTATYQNAPWRGVLLLDKSKIRAGSLIFDKPLIDYMISYFLLAGVRDIQIVCTADERQFISTRFRDGEALGTRITFTDTDSSIKCSHNDIKNEAGIGDVMLVTEPFFIYGADLTRFLQRAMHHRGDIVNLTSVVGMSNEKSGNGFSNYVYRSTPFYFLSEAHCVQHNTSTGLLSFLLKQSEETICFEPMDKGFIFSVLDSPEDIAKISTLVQIIQELGDYLIYCPFEIAWRRGMIDKPKMKKEALAFFEYREHINSIN